MVGQYLIMPMCSDLNRGDQALVWETKRIAEEAGYEGKYFLLASKNEPVRQSEGKGLSILHLILEHPSRFGKSNNINYGISLKIKWGLVAFFDLFFSLMFLNKFTRKMAKRFLSSDKQRTLEKIENCDAVFVKGGGFIHAYGGIVSLYSIYFQLYHVMLAQHVGKPVYILPNSFGPFEGIGVKRLVKDVLRHCEFVSSRENISTEMVRKELGISIETFPDLGFYLPRKGTKNQYMDMLAEITDRKKVALTMRPYRFPKSSDPKQAYIHFKKSLSMFIDWLFDEGYMPVLVEHTLSITEHENDFSCIEEVTKEVDSSKYIVVSDKNLDCMDLKEIYSQCDYIVATRFHSLIFSLTVGVKGIAITYGGNKGNGIMHDMNLEEYGIAIEDVSFFALKEKFLQLKENSLHYDNKVEDYLKYTSQMRELIKENLTKNR